MERTKQKIRAVFITSTMRTEMFNSEKLKHLYIEKMFEVVDRIREEYKLVLKQQAKEIVKTRFGNESDDDKADMNAIEKCLNELYGKGEYEETEFGKMMNAVEGYLKKQTENIQNRPLVVLQNN